MIENAKFVHTNLIARNWRGLAKFYEDVFGAIPIPPQRDYFGNAIEAATVVKGARIQGAHLQLPGFGNDGPTLEIFEYNEIEDKGLPQINQPGFAHIAFQVDFVNDAIEEFLSHGGSQLGESVTLTIANGAQVTLAYMRDPEGNIVELQSWTS